MVCHLLPLLPPVEIEETVPLSVELMVILVYWCYSYVIIIGVVEGIISITRFCLSVDVHSFFNDLNNSERT